VLFLPCQKEPNHCSIVAELQAMYEKEKASSLYTFPIVFADVDTLLGIESESKFDNLKRVLSDQLR
jgi:hypothetical protein